MLLMLAETQPYLSASYKARMYLMKEGKEGYDKERSDDIGFGFRNTMNKQRNHL